ncbi:hypothetical protein H3H37_10620 [Duganella sp. LX20W]|uniref:Flagellar hook-length control protein FliK n=1 Tax=Rugamonas brunnea TaxID=2758569 RepID=A0A7W2ERX5_9BURK|nr:hypothetical protein [Rugamonas brunnea]MBA5637507.1 hypothetical protein [Rugamonas brunnea]
MAFDRIGPTTAPLSVPDRPTPLPQSQTGATSGGDGGGDYPLAPVTPAAVELLTDTAESLPLPRAGLDTLAAQLAADTPNAADPAAMHPNQVFLSRQLVWAPPDTASLASSWLVMVHTYGQQRAALQEQAQGQHVPSSLFMADHTPAVLREGRGAAPLVTELEPWRFAVYAWGAEQLVLRVVNRDQEQDDDHPRRRAPRIALRLELMLPGIGRVVIQMEPLSGGVVLEVGAQQSSALQHMREMLPQLAATVSRSGLTIIRCRVMREIPLAAQHYPERSQLAALTPALFKAMAEVAVLLSHPLPPDEL